MNGITIFKIVAVIVGIVLFAGITISAMATSYAEYQVYYEAIMAEREYQKYLQSLPYTFEGVSVSLNDGVSYYATGKARPSKDDFTVIAHFSEKGKAIDSILSSSDFEIDIPDDFSVNGGKVTVRYAYQPAKEEGATEDPKPVIKTAEIDLSLTPVVLTGLKLTENPYRVYYSDAMSFDADGIELEAAFNCGDVVTLSASDVKIVNTGKLTAGAESAKVSYTVGDVTLEADVPITVKAAAEYDEGDIIGIKAEGDVFVNEGQRLSEATPIIRATYDNGNRLLLTSADYTVSGNVEKATFFNNCILSVSLKANPIINCRSSATVRFAVEAEDGTAVGATENTVDGVTVVDSFTDGSSLNFLINSSNIAKGSLSLRIANTSANAVNLSDILTLKVNGRVILVPGSTVAANSEFADYVLPEIVLNAGDNTIQFTFYNMSGVGLAIDKLNLETEYAGVVFSNMSEYLVNNLEEGTNPELTVEMIKDFHTVNGGTYIHGMCTDGTYIYAVRTTYSNGLRGLLVTKHDAITFDVIATSVKTAAGAKEANAGITYYDGKIIVYFADGTEWCIDPSLSGQWTEYKGFTFEGLDGTGLRDVYYNNETQQFAVLASSNISVYGKDMKLLHSFGMQKESGGNIMRMSGDSAHLYVVFSKNGAYQPIVHMYDWSGEFVGRIVVPNGADVVGSNINFAKTNVQGMVTMNDDLYFAFLRFSQTDIGNDDGVAILKASYPSIDGPLTNKLTVGEYIAAAVDKGVTPSATARPSTGSIGRIDTNAGNYAMGGASDGEYLYVSMNSSSNTTTVLCKVDPATNKVVAKTVTFKAADASGDNSKIFIMDGVLYCIIRDGSMYSIALKDFNGDNCSVEKSSISFSEYGTAISATYNESAGRVAVVTNDKKLHILNDDMNTYKRDIALKYGNLSPASACSDDKFIYVSYKSGDNKTSTYIDVYTWDGTKVGNFTVSGYTLGEDVKFNIQAFYFHNGEMHSNLCSWTNGYSAFFDWVIDVDQSVLNP